MKLNIGKVEDYEFFLDLIFSRAKKRVAMKKASIKGRSMEKAKALEHLRFDIINSVVADRFNILIQEFPSINDLNDFYTELFRAVIDVDNYKKSLSSLNWASKQVSKMRKLHDSKVDSCENIQALNKLRASFYGRVSSILKRVNKHLLFLDDARKKIESLPVIKEKIFTVAIVGFPNVGKTTLLSKLTPSKPEIAGYSFTTKGINVAYMGNKEIQLLDTPGTLNRFNKMNNIEKQAYLAIKHCANLLVYVLDLTETYPLNDQIKLLENLKDFKKHILVFLSKTDLLEKEKIVPYQKKFKAFTDINDLKNFLMKEK